MIASRLSPRLQSNVNAPVSRRRGQGEASWSPGLRTLTTRSRRSLSRAGASPGVGPAGSYPSEVGEGGHRSELADVPGFGEACKRIESSHLTPARKAAALVRPRGNTRSCEARQRILRRQRRPQSRMLVRGAPATGRLDARKPDGDRQPLASIGMLSAGRGLDACAALMSDY